MSYPQPSSESAVINRSGFFRLVTPLVSDGDIYESAVGANTIMLGPESDISKVNIGYYDPSQANRMSIATCDAQRPFVGPVSAFGDPQSLYTPSNVQGNLLFWPTELWNPNFSPFLIVDLFNSNNYRVDYVTPVLDIIQYFGPPPATPPQRTDKTYRWERLPFTINNPSLDGNAIMVPYYGRKYASISFMNLTDASITFAVYGVNFGYNTPNITSQMVEIVAETVVAPNPFVTTSGIVRASVDGMFDALALMFYNYSTTPLVPTGTVNLRVTVSDNAL